MNPAELLYVAFTKYVIALDRATGTLQWEWLIPDGKRYPALLVDGDKVFVSAMGYTYCLDASTGALIWENPLSGYGIGVACLATQSAHTSSSRAAALAEETQQQGQQHHHS